MNRACYPSGCLHGEQNSEDCGCRLWRDGLGSPEIAAPILGADRIAVGVVGGFGASIRAPGHAHHNGMEMIRFGAFAGLPKQLLQASAKIWESAGFKVALFDDIKQMVWDDMIRRPAKAA